MVAATADSLRARFPDRDPFDALVVGDNPIKAVRYLDLRQSMRNGGGPACLRMRIVMHEQQLEQMRPRVFMDDALYARLTAWVDKHYREALSAGDLGDPDLLVESRAALDELTQILHLGPVYPESRTPGPGAVFG